MAADKSTPQYGKCCSRNPQEACQTQVWSIWEAFLGVAILRFVGEADWGLVRLTRVVVMQKREDERNTQEGGETVYTESQRRDFVVVLQGVPFLSVLCQWCHEVVQICRLGQKREQ